MDWINGIIIGLATLIVSVVGLGYQIKTNLDNKEKEFEKEKIKRIEDILECIEDINSIPRILEIFYCKYTSRDSCTTLENEYIKKKKIAIKLYNIFNFFDAPYVQRDLLVIKNILKYFIDFLYSRPNEYFNKLQENINSCFKLEQNKINELVIKFLKDKENKKKLLKIENTKSYKIEVCREKLHNKIMERVESNKYNVAELPSAITEYFNNVFEEIKTYIRAYEKNDVEAMSKITKEKKDAIALHFINAGFEKVDNEINEYERNKYLLEHRRQHKEFIGRSDRETLYSYYYNDLINSSFKFINEVQKDSVEV